MDPDNAKEVAEQTDGLAFLGTPFGGSDTAKWTAVFERLSRLIYSSSVNKNLLDHLRTDSHELKLLIERFSKWLDAQQKPGGKRIHIVWFYEEQASKYGHIVPHDSARLQPYREISLPADHQGICKFDNLQDTKNIEVRNFLMQCIDDIKAADKDEEFHTVSDSFDMSWSA